MCSQASSTKHLKYVEYSLGLVAGMLVLHTHEDYLIESLMLSDKNDGQSQMGLKKVLSLGNSKSGNSFSPDVLLPHLSPQALV